MIGKISNFFAELSEKDEPTKKVWLIALTSLSMMIVLAFWGTNFNNTVKNLSQPVVEIENDSFVAAMETGAGVIYERTGLKLSRVVDAIKTAVSKTNSIKIDKENTEMYQPFIKKDLEEISVKKLP